MPDRIIFLALFLGGVWVLYQEREGGNRYISRMLNEILEDTPKPGFSWPSWGGSGGSGGDGSGR